MKKISLILLMLTVTHFYSWASTFTVTNNDGLKTTVGSLTYNIIQANAAGVGPHTIVFDPSLLGQTITPALGDLDITNSDITIDGWSVYGSIPACGTLPGIKVIANGFNGWEVFGENNTIQGLCIHGGIQLKGTGSHKIYGNHFNIDLDGSTVLTSSAAAAIYLTAGSNNIIGDDDDCLRNVIASNGPRAIYDNGSGGFNTIKGNYCGTYKDGTTATTTSSFSNAVINIDTAPNDVISYNVVGRGTRGIYIDGGGANTRVEYNNVGANKNRLFDNNLALSSSPIAFNGNAADFSRIIGNVSGNSTLIAGYPDGANICVQDAGNDNFTISGNYVGVDIAYNKKGTAWCGIFTRGDNTLITGNIIGDNGITNTSQYSHGVGMEASLNTTITDNYIGVTPTGLDIGNGDAGIEINGGSTYTISGNFIGFNKGLRATNSGGISIVNGTTTGTISNNYIGVLDNNANCGNSESGIYIEKGTIITISGNKIAYNTEDAIEFNKPGSGSSTRDFVFITENCMWCNGNRGINFNIAAGVGANANFAESFTVAAGTFAGVVINDWGTGATNSDSVTYIGSNIWKVRGHAPANSRVELFKTGPCKDCSSDAVQGQTFLGFTNTDANGLWEIDVQSSSVGRGFVATASDMSVTPGRTSEYSNCRQLANPCNVHNFVNLTKPSSPIIICEGDPFDIQATYSLKPHINCNNGVNFTWMKNGVAISGSSLTYADYSVTNAATNDAGTYSISITDAIPEAIACSNLTLPIKTTDTIEVIVRSLLACCDPKTFVTHPQNQTICEGNNHTFTSEVTGTTITYQWQIDQGSGFTDISGETNQNYIVTNAAATLDGSVYRVKVLTTGKCEEFTNAATLTVNPLPLEPTSTTPINYCQGEPTSQLSATALANHTINWWGTAAVGGSSSSTAPTPSSSSAGSTSYYVSQVNNTTTCESPRLEIVVNINVVTADPSVTSTETYCQNATASALTADALANHTLNWWGTDATGGTSTTTATIPSTASAGVTTYYVSQTNDATSCISNRVPIVVTVNGQPNEPIVSTPITYCQDATASNLSATALASHTLNWWGTDASGGSASSTVITPQTVTAGTTTYYVSQYNNTTLCESERAQIVVTINANPLAPSATSPITYCLNESTSALTATALASHSLNWWGTDASGGSSSSTAPTPSSSAVGSTSYYVSQTNDATTCESPRTEIEVIVGNNPTAPGVTSPVNYCKDAAATALTASGTSLKWYTVSTGGASSPTAPTPSTSTVGSTSYYVSSSFGSCEGPRSEIVVTINAIPALPGVTSRVNYCQNATATALSATALANHTLNWWGTDASGGSSSTTATIPSTTTVGAASYYVSQTNDATTCESAREVIVVNINAIPLVPSVASPVNYCQNATATALSATALANHTLNWWGLDASGGSSTTTPNTPSTSTVGVTTYYVSQTNDASTCESAREPIVVNINAIPALPGVSTPVAYCQNATATGLTATALTSHTLNWWGTDATGGTSSVSAPTPSTSTVGSTSYYVSQTNDATTCESAREEIVVTINAIPALPGVTSPVNYCQNATATALSATALASHTLNWWGTDASGGSSATTATIPSTASVGTSSYYVSQTNDASTCESARAIIEVETKSIPNAPGVTSPVSYCQNDATTQLTATGANLTWYTTATIISGSTNAPTPSSATSGTPAESHYVSQTVNGCESPRAVININVTNAPNTGLTVSIDKPEVCSNGSATITVNSTESFVTYAIKSGIGTELSKGVFEVNASELTDGTNTITITGTSCKTLDLTNTVSILKIPSVSAITGNTNICDNDLTQSYSVIDETSNGVGSYNWVTNSGTIVSGATTANVTIDFAVNNNATLAVNSVGPNGTQCTNVISSDNINFITSYQFNDVLSFENDTICENYLMNVTVQNSSAQMYNWKVPSDAKIVISNDDSSAVTIQFGLNSGDLIIKPNHQCNTNIPVIDTLITVILLPNVDLGDDQVLNSYQTINLQNNGSSVNPDLYNFNWSIDNTISTIATTNNASAVFNINAIENTITLNVDAKGVKSNCSNSADIFVEVKSDIVIPTVFSPNDDNNHDQLTINGIEYFPEAVIEIYNQWGELVYESAAGYINPWDGTKNGVKCPVGTYYYVLNPNRDGFEKITGFISILK